MDQTVLVAHILGLAFLLQAHMAVYAFRRKKTRKSAVTLRQVVGK